MLTSYLQMQKLALVAMGSTQGPVHGCVVVWVRFMEHWVCPWASYGDLQARCPRGS